MGWTGEKDEILEPHWVNCSMIERYINENQMQGRDLRTGMILSAD